MSNAASKEKTFSAHYISGTHWDREWYRPWQEYRVLLVKLLDELLELMETSKDFKYFQLDGQTCIIEDYLEIRPQNTQRLARLIKSGRILVGPWYTMPDLFCPGDEALVRSLLLGQRIAREWGVEPMNVGFICDMFGHPAQMPQIFRGFDMQDCVLGRGTNESTTPMFFHWESPDGSRVFTYKLQDHMGYGAFAVPRAVMEKPAGVIGEQHAHIGQALNAVKDDPRKYAQVQQDLAAQEVGKYVGHETRRCNGGAVALMDTMDHIAPAKDVAMYLKLIRQACPNVEPAHSTLPLFFEDARKTAGALPVKKGELREPSRNKAPYLWLIPYCTSSRVRMKQANDQCQNLLQRWVEPMLALANLHGAAIPTRFLDLAWKWLITNHAHDSICGCSIDQVHRDMMFRFDQVRVLGEQLKHQAIGALTAQCSDLARNEKEFTLTLVNPLPSERNEVVIFDVDLPTDYASTQTEGFRTQTQKAFALEDASGKRVPYQRLGFTPVHQERSRFAQYCFINDGPFTRYTVAAKVRLPALGFTSLRVTPSDTPVRHLGTLRTGPTAAENEHLAIAIEPNGTLTLTDKASKQTYTGLLLLEDRSEIGDGWFHGHSLNDEQTLSAASPAQVAVVHEGPEVVTFSITVRLNVPLRYDFAKERPTEERVDVAVTHRVSLRRSARVVDVQTTIDNTAQDHRLRLLLPTDATAAKVWHAHHPFDVAQRPIKLDPATHDWQEAEIPEKPFLGFEAVGGERRGLAFICGAGLHEGGVIDDARRTMTVTLMRGYRRTVGTEGETDGLELGRIVHHYALMPYKGQLPRQEILDELAKLQAGLSTRQTGPRPSGYPPMTGKNPPHATYLAMDTGPLVVSAIKASDEGQALDVRLWNPTSKAQSHKLLFWKPVRSARMLKLNESVDPTAQEPRRSGPTVTVEAGPHAIVTVRVEL